MHICKGNISYECSQIKTYTFNETSVIRFSIFEPVSSHELAKLFEDDTFYFYDDIYNSKILEINNTQLVGLRIDYNANSTCKITLKLIEGADDNASKI